MNRLLSKHSILIVDNDEISRQTIAHLIAYKLPDLNLHVADSLTAAIEACNNSKIDIIVVDIINNISLSTDFTSSARESNPNIKFILTTNCSEPDRQPCALSSDNIRVACTPVDLNELLFLIKKSVLMFEA